MVQPVVAIVTSDASPNVVGRRVGPPFACLRMSASCLMPQGVMGDEAAPEVGQLSGPTSRAGGAADLIGSTAWLKAVFRIAAAVAYAVLGDAYLAQDAAQETSVAAWRSREELRADAWRGWVAVVAKRKALDLQEKRRGEDPLPEDDLPHPQDLSERAVMRVLIEEAMAALPPTLARHLRLYYIDGYSQKEIAAAMRRNHGTVRNDMVRARRMLRESLGL